MVSVEPTPSSSNSKTARMLKSCVAFRDGGFKNSSALCLEVAPLLVVPTELPTKEHNYERIINN